MSFGPGKELRYPVPLPSGQLATLWLPRELSRSDAERMVAFINSLVFDKEKA